MLSLPILAVAALGSLIGNLGQIGFLFTSYPLKPDLKKLDPIKGFKKIFSKDRAVEFIKQLIKFRLLFFMLFIMRFKILIHQVSLLFRIELSRFYISYGRALNTLVLLG